ncbi:MAG: hypothetical protein WKG00_21495, partial [Polyangiaceae bacterium]
MQRRLVADVVAALKRRPAGEAKLAGAARALAPHCGDVRKTLSEALEVLVRRESFERELYGTAVRALTELTEKRALPPLRDALASEEAGGFAALSAACFSRDSTLSAPLSRAASSRHAHVAFAAEVARLARGEASAARLESLAPKIKESHRIALCVEMFVPLVWTGRASVVRREDSPPAREGGAEVARAGDSPQMPASVAAALAVLRGAERHLGRWLVLAEVAVRAGDPLPVIEARARSEEGPVSSRSAWTLVRWALESIRIERPADQPRAEPAQTAAADPPAVRPTAELVARLSDRPSSDRDMSFLFRLARTGAPGARPMLEGIAKVPLVDEVAVRAAGSLARAYGREDLRRELLALARDPKREELRGLAAASLWDAGDRGPAEEAAEPLLESKARGRQVWASLVRGV